MGKVFQKSINKLITTDDLDWKAATTFKALLMKKGAGASLQADTHDFFNDIPAAKRAGTADKIVDLGGSANRAIDTATTGKIYLQCSETSYTFNTVSTDSIEGIVVFKSSGNSTTSPLLIYDSLSAITDSDGGSFKITFTSQRIATFSF